MSAAPGDNRLRALLDTGVAITSELSLDSLLQRLVAAAVELTDARYAALGVIDRSGRQLERFVATGIDAETHAAIGDLPRGRGILGALIQDATPLRLHDLAEDPRSVGFPPHHPPMRSFLGVPILLRGVAYGNLYLTEKTGGADFTEDDQELVSLLASQAAVAIENARLYEAATGWSKQLESLNEVADALLNESDLDRLLQLIATRLRELLNARVVAVLLPSGGDSLRFAAAAGEGATEIVGTQIPRSDSKSGRVMERGHSERVDSVLDDPDVNVQAARVLAARTGLWVPLWIRGRAIGVIEAHDKQANDVRFDDADLRLAETFASRAAVAVDLSERIARDALAGVVAAQESERRRLARELHDETGQALTSILLRVKALEETVDSAEARESIAGLRELVVSTLGDVRRLAIELRPSVLDDFGLVPALERLTESFAEQSRIPVDFHAALPAGRLPSEAETALYRIVQESLTNVVKHARATRVSVVLNARNGAVTAIVEDDGRGFDESAKPDGFGLVGMRERLAALGGRLTVESGSAGTSVVAEVPL